MKHPHWSEIYYYFREVEQQQSNLKSGKLTKELVSTTRNSLIISMNQLKNNLKQILDDESVHLITFALTALLDEEVLQLVNAAPQNIEWVPLQKEFFNLTNAGEMFFEYLDEALENPNLSPIVFEIFYFVLKKGYRGKYEHSKNRIIKYIEFLSDRIPHSSFNTKDKARQLIQPLPKIKIKIWQYYVGAGAVMLCAYIAVIIHTNLT